VSEAAWIGEGFGTKWNALWKNKIPVSGAMEFDPETEQYIYIRPQWIGRSVKDRFDADVWQRIMDSTPPE
jgi:hypothetical protein